MARAGRRTTASPDGRPIRSRSTRRRASAGLWSYLCRQEAAGEVAIAGTDPRTPPIIDHDYLAAGADIARFGAMRGRPRRSCWRPARSAGTPRAGCEPDLDLPTHLFANLAPAHHQSGTCRMGPDARDSVVGPDLRVHGLDGLLVADSSVFPDTVMHNTNLACYVIGEVAA